MSENKNLNLPNVLSAYRIMIFPLVMYFALSGREQLFVTFLVVNLITDILDGWIARRFNLQTEFGARLDSMADVGTYILAIVGIFTYKLLDFEPHLLSFLIFVGLFLTCNLFALIKFGRLPSLHLYSSKIGGYIQGVFFFVLFVFGFNTIFYYFMIIWGILSFLEHLTVQILIKEMRSNAKGLYWVLKENRLV